MPFKKQQQLVEAAIETVDWAALGSLSDDMIARRWQGDRDASWPSDEQLAEFKLMDVDAPSRPPQAAE